MIPISDDGVPGLERRPARAVRLAGDAAAVAWVAEVLRGAGVAVTADPSAGPGEGPIVWVAREVAPPADEGPVWGMPCLVVIPPGGALPATLAGCGAVESFEIVRQPEDAAILTLRVERLLLLHRRKTQTEIVLHNLSDVVYTRTFDGVLTSINAAGERLFGRRRDDLVGRPLARVAAGSGLPADIVARTNAELQSSGRSGGRLAFSDHQGRPRVFDREALLLLDGHGKPVGVQVILKDVTEELASRQRLERDAERNEVLAAIACAARDSLDLDRILREATALLGRRIGAQSVRVWLVDEACRLATLAVSWRGAEEVPPLEGTVLRREDHGELEELFRTLEPIVVRDAACQPAGSVREHLQKVRAGSLAAVPIRREGEMIGLLGLAFGGPRPFPEHEILFYRRVADQLALAVRAARLYARLEKQVAELAQEQSRREEADRSRESLSAMLVHDLKNPLTAVTAALELTLEKAHAWNDERLARMLGGSLASARSLQGQIEDALLVYRPGDAPEPEKRCASVADALAVPLEEARWLAQLRRVALTVDVAADLPPVPLDVPRFRRAAANLLGNAVKFTPTGGEVSVRAALLADGDGGPRFLFEVADTGPGVPEALRGSLATPWVRLHGSEKVPGTGLGLAVAQKVAASHGGCLQVAGREGGGSIFSIVLPARTARATARSG